MPETIEKIVLQKTTNTKLIKFGVFRSENGIEIIAESKPFENFFKRNKLNTDEVKWEGTQPYNYPNGLDDNTVALLHYWKKGLFTDREHTKPNLSFLRAKGLGTGKTFVITDSIYSKTEIARFTKNAREEIKKFFDQFMKPVNVSVEIVFTINDDTE